MSHLFVIDTSVFVNPASGQAFGAGPTEALRAFLEMVRQMPAVEICMPPSIHAELMHFVEVDKIPSELLLGLHQKAPRRAELKVPGAFLFDLVEDMRDRVDRGLRLAERHVREALQTATQPPAAPGEKAVRPDAEAIGRLRETYRRIMREGALDSRADVDLLLLAYELDGTLVSADQGVVDWADRLGLRILPHSLLKEKLISLKA